MNQDDNYAGPTADELQPKNRLEKGLLYSEHLEMMVGPERAAQGVHLEICGVSLTVARLKVDGGGKNTKAALLVSFKAPTGFVAPPGVAFDGKHLPWRLGTNQTNKETLAQLHNGDTVVTRWVGWVTLYVDHKVSNPKAGGALCKGIRIKNKRPNLKPTFEYRNNVEARIAQAREARRKSAQQPSKPLMQQEEPAETVELSADEMAQIEAQERQP